MLLALTPIHYIRSRLVLSPIYSVPFILGWLIALAVIVCLGLCVYVPIKLALAPPMALARKRVELFGSWRVDRPAVPVPDRSG